MISESAGDGDDRRRQLAGQRTCRRPRQGSDVRRLAPSPSSTKDAGFRRTKVIGAASLIAEGSPGSSGHGATFPMDKSIDRGLDEGLTKRAPELGEKGWPVSQQAIRFRRRIRKPTAMPPEILLARVAQELGHSSDQRCDVATCRLTLVQQGEPRMAELGIASQGTRMMLTATVSRQSVCERDAIPLWLLLVMLPVGFTFATGVFLGPLCIAAILYVVWPVLADEIAIRRRLRRAVDRSSGCTP